ncbi:divalent-cation tolerance protein CutA [bacterium]
MNESKYCIVYVTVSSEEEGRKVAEAVVGKKIAACANMIGPIRSLYWWKGAVQDDPEMLLIMKTSTDMFERLREAVLEAHSYEVPEIIAAPIIAGHPPYLDWIGESVEK